MTTNLAPALVIMISKRRGHPIRGPAMCLLSSVSLLLEIIMTNSEARLVITCWKGMYQFCCVCSFFEHVKVCRPLALWKSLVTTGIQIINFPAALAFWTLRSKSPILQIGVFVYKNGNTLPTGSLSSAFGVTLSELCLFCLFLLTGGHILGWSRF